MMIGMGFFGILIMILFWGGLIALAVWLVSLLFPTAGRSANNASTPRSAEEILDLRYARGELNDEQYQQMRQTIGVD